MAEITLRQNKTSALLFAEMDANFQNINQELIDNTNKLNAATDNNTVDTLVFRNSSGDISVSTVHGDLDGSALQVVANNADTTAGTHYISFLSGQTGDRDNLTDVALTYDPSLNKLTAGTFSGIGQFTTLTSTGNTTIGDAAGDILTVNATPTFLTNVTMVSDLAVNGGDITTSATSFKLLDTVATTIDFAKAATALTIGAVTGTTVIRNDVTIKGGTAWHSLNDGSGSGLDADLLDGYQSSSSSTNNTIVLRTATGGINASSVIVSGDLETSVGNLVTTNSAANVFNTSAMTLNIGGDATTINIGAVSGTTDIKNTLTVNGNTVYHTGNDGSGSGLDADLLDGYNSSVSAVPNTVVVRDGTGAIVGTITGTTDNANKVATSSNNDNATYYPTFVKPADITAGYAPMYADNSTTPMSYNPSTNTLTVANVVGNADTATDSITAERFKTARTINGVSFNGTSNITVEPFIESDEGTNATRYITFVDDSVDNHKRLNEDSSLTYNPSTNTLSVANIDGNATTASEWTTARTITLGGDLSGNVSIDGSSNVTLNATVNANSVALGTDTTGNYVGEGATSGNGISGSLSAEGGVFTVTSNATSSNTANTIVYRNASGNFNAGTITASLNGNASTATTLQTARTINGVSFNGTSNITVEPFIESDEGTNATRYITFVDDSVDNHKRLNEDSSLTYNPSTNTLSVANIDGNATTASEWTTARTITLGGDLSGNVSIDGSSNVTLNAIVADDSHNHIVANIDGLQDSLDDIVTNTSNIATNTADIATNTGKLDEYAGRNRIINGSMRIAQRGEAAFTAAVSGYAGPDRFIAINQAQGQFTQRQGSMTIGGITRPCVEQEVDTVLTDISGGNFWHGISQRIEGNNAYDLVDEAFTVSGWAEATVAGDYSLAIKDSITAKSYVTSITLAADTPTYFEVNVPADSGLTTPQTAGVGLSVTFGVLNTGTFQTATLDTWQSGNFLSASGAVNWGLTSGAKIRLAELQLEKGAVATEFERVDYGAELARCQRYFWPLDHIVETCPIHESSTLKRMQISWPRTMRAVPTVSGLTASIGTPSFVSIGESGGTVGISGLGAGTPASITAFNLDSEL